MKKQYSLALGGGAAIGLLHIGVIKYIEEKNIKITELSGTSMGSIIASFYALGKTSDEMEKFAEEIKIIKMLDFDLMSGFLKGDKIVKKIHEVVGDKLIEDLDIKLKIVATNINSGKKKVFIKGKIIDAIRASISLPGIFKPHKVGDEFYIDGGILNNLPVEILEGKNIIAVSALKKIQGPIKRTKKVLGLNMNTGFFSMNFQILQRSILLMMKQNEETSIKTPNKNIIFIYPNTTGLEIYSFDKVKELINAGYKEIKKELN